jgi:predicted AAA+ superfamily ATPase
MADLLNWRDATARKPLVLQGARQVGKTWLLKEFGQECFKNVAYLNFEETPTAKSLFDGDFEIDRILAGLRALTGQPIVAGSTLLILDEIQECTRALTSLKYFAELRPEYHVACAGSLLGVALHEGTSFPVGKVNFLDLYPLSFSEFARAVGKESLLEPMHSYDWGLVSAFHDEYVVLLRDYMFVGGMPDPVNVFVESKDYRQARAAQVDILRAYDNDFSKHAPSEEVPRIRAIWRSIPEQLAKETARFTYSNIAPGARGRQYAAALQWLEQTGLVYAVNRVTAPRLPLPSYRESSVFKLYALDVGLLGALSDLDPTVVVEGNRLFTEFKGSLAEEYVAQSLVASQRKIPVYWAPEKGGAEVDFLVPIAGDVIPVEVKAERNLRAKSLKSYINRFQPKHALRMSLSKPFSGDSIIDLPLYAVDFLSPELLNSFAN